MPRLLSLNLGVIRTVVHKGEEVPTGIFKSSVAGPAHLGLEGFEGDQVADRRNHGGLEKATYLYPWEHYAYWRERLGRDDLEPGQFGENLTTVGLDERSVLIGERFQIGEAVIEACQARIPCFKLELRMERPGMVEEFLKAERPGIYFRVLHPGRVATNDAIESIHRPDGAATVWEANHTLHFDRVNLRAVRRVLAADCLSRRHAFRWPGFGLATEVPELLARTRSFRLDAQPHRAADGCRGHPGSADARLVRGSREARVGAGRAFGWARSEAVGRVLRR